MLINYPVLQHKQKGSALMAVLVIVIVVTILGVTAMRMSLTGLTIATNSQASNLLFQTADLGIQRLQMVVNGGNSAASAATAMRAGGILGDKGDNALCMSTRGAVWQNGAGAVNGFSAGPCNTNNTAHYVSDRNLAMAQVNYLRQPLSAFDSNAGTTRLSVLGTSAAPIDPDVVTVTSTSIMPTLGSADRATINECLTKPSDDSGKLKATDDDDKATAAIVVTVTDCLTDSGAIFTSHQDVYLLGL